jgi:hypothetical protein
MGQSAHPDQHSGPARQWHGPDHGDAEQGVTDHEQDRRQPIYDHHRQVLVDWGPAPPATAWPKPGRGSRSSSSLQSDWLFTISSPWLNRINVKSVQKVEALKCAVRVLQCEGGGYEDAEALHGRRRVCTRHGCLLRGWRRGDGIQRCGGVDPGDRTAGPGLDRGRGCGRRVVLHWRVLGRPDGVSGHRRAGGFLRHPSIGWAHARAAAVDRMAWPARRGARWMVGAARPSPSGELCAGGVGGTRFSVPSATTKTAATQRTSQRAKRPIKTLRDARAA